MYFYFSRGYSPVKRICKMEEKRVKSKDYAMNEPVQHLSELFNNYIYCEARSCVQSNQTNGAANCV